MPDPNDHTTAIGLERGYFPESERVLLRHGDLSASLFRYPTGVEAIRLGHPRGEAVILPYLGQMVWSATFDGVELAMHSMFDVPRPAQTIVETYGCLMFHSGLLRNGVPGAEDTHALHGEMPCMAMDRAGLGCGTDDKGSWIAVTGARDYAVGFGAHYRATPHVTLHAGDTGLRVTMEVENRGAAPMDLMYLAHVNFGFAEGARIVQPVPFDPAHVVTRTVVPGFVTPSEDYKTAMRAFAEDPSLAAVLDDPWRFSPEQVFYIKGLTPGPDGLVRFALARREGDGFTIAYDPVAMPHTVRWLLDNGDQRVAAFAMPSTCEPEGYSAEKRKGHVRALAAGARAVFTTRFGYLDRAATADLTAAIDRRTKERR